MFQFENQLSKLKHDVLTRIAILAKQNKVTREELAKIPYEMIQGDIPRYRDNVQHERDVILERAKLASGYLPNGKYSDELINISEENKILYVIKTACDRCPTKKFEVTDACRNCIAHKCKSACNFGAISYVNGKAHIDTTKCKECGMCKKACPYDAIAQDMRPCKRACPTGAINFNKYDLCSEITESKCVSCGACMAACPFGAIEDKSSIVKVVNELMSKNNIYAVVAPAIAGQFNPTVKYGQIKNSIIKLGFKDMVEAACGADAVTVHESNEFVERISRGDAYMTNSCCPGFVNYIKIFVPDQSEMISSTVSPMVATGRYIKNKCKNAKVVFIGPCTAKKNECLLDSSKDAIDYVITFEELFALLDAFEIDPSQCEDVIVNDGSILGRGFAIGGGLIASIESYISEKGIESDFKPINVSGGREIKKVMTMAKIRKLNGNFIEGMMCEGGCINGAAKVVSSTKAKSNCEKVNSQGKIKSVLSNETLDEFKNIDLKR